MSEVTTKDPTKVKAGTIGAIKRWGDGPPRTVKLDDLTPDQRRLVVALVDAAKAANTQAA